MAVAAVTTGVEAVIVAAAARSSSVCDKGRWDTNTMSMQHVMHRGVIKQAERDVNFLQNHGKLACDHVMQTSDSNFYDT